MKQKSAHLKVNTVQRQPFLGDQRQVQGLLIVHVEGGAAGVHDYCCVCYAGR